MHIIKPYSRLRFKSIFAILNFVPIPILINIEKTQRETWETTQKISVFFSCRTTKLFFFVFFA